MRTIPVQVTNVNVVVSPEGTTDLLYAERTHRIYGTSAEVRQTEGVPEFVEKSRLQVICSRGWSSRENIPPVVVVEVDAAVDVALVRARQPVAGAVGAVIVLRLTLYVGVTASKRRRARRLYVHDDSVIC